MTDRPDVLREALREALSLLDEVYAHIGPDGKHLPGAETKIWVHETTVKYMGDRLATLRAALATPDPAPHDEEASHG